MQVPRMVKPRPMVIPGRFYETEKEELICFGDAPMHGHWCIRALTYYTVMYTRAATVMDNYSCNVHYLWRTLKIGPKARFLV